MDLHLLDAYPYLTGGPPFLQHELCIGIIHPTDFVIEPKYLKSMARQGSVDRRIGGLEIVQVYNPTCRVVDRRIGGLEIHYTAGYERALVDRRIGGLESISTAA